MSPALEELKILILSHSMKYWESIENGTTILNALQSLLKVSKCKTNNDMQINSNLNLQDEMDLIIKESGSDFWTPAQSVCTDLSTDIDYSEDDTTEENYITADEGYEVPTHK